VEDEITQLMMVEALSMKTGMTTEYARLCMMGDADWNYELALKSFEEYRARLPAEAFITAAEALAVAPAAAQGTGEEGDGMDVL
jgi:hypothetical protein